MRPPSAPARSCRGLATAASHGRGPSADLETSTSMGVTSRSCRGATGGGQQRQRSSSGRPSGEQDGRGGLRPTSQAHLRAIRRISRTPPLRIGPPARHSSPSIPSRRYSRTLLRTDTRLWMHSAATTDGCQSHRLAQVWVRASQVRRPRRESHGSAGAAHA